MAPTRRYPQPMSQQPMTQFNIDAALSNSITTPSTFNLFEEVTPQQSYYLPSQTNLFDSIRAGTAGPVPTTAGYSPLKQSQSTTSPPKIDFLQHSYSHFPQPSAPVPSDSITKQPYTAVYENMTGRAMGNGLLAHIPTWNSADGGYTYNNDNVAEWPASDAQAMPESTLGQSTSPIPIQTQQEISNIPIPEPEDMPAIIDDGKKPGFTYTQLIAQAILRAPGRRLSLDKIYKWISDNFAFYRVEQSKSGWQNSIRHNLSLNQNFSKIQRPKNDPGKGNYWSIAEGKEHSFLQHPHNKQKKQQRPASSAGAPNLPQPQLDGESFSHSGVNFAVSLADGKSEEHTTAILDGAAEDLSSDATIPGSDPAMFEDSMPPPALPVQDSSPLHALKSSPPVPGHGYGLVPALGIDIPSSATARRKRKREQAHMDDSGYYSSLESSALRATPNPLYVGSLKLSYGRAERELARLRSSSFDGSPRKRHKSDLQNNVSQLLSSSPLRTEDHSPWKAPGTPLNNMPRKSFARRAPPFESPNAHLQEHRIKMQALAGSPPKPNDLNDITTYSPAFKLLDDDYHTFRSPRFPIYNDSPCKSMWSPPKTGNLSRATNALADIIGTSTKRNPILTRPSMPSPLRQQKSPIKSPTKAGHLQALDLNYSQLLNDDIFSGFEDDGVDLLGGFTQIGEKENLSPTQPTKNRARPVLGARSATTQF